LFIRLILHLYIQVYRDKLFLLQGEYRVVTEKIYPCESTRNHLIKFNLYFSKKTSNITELKGNFTYLIPLDDTLIVSSYFILLDIFFSF